MKKTIIFLTILSLLFLTGCGMYGQGKSYGYITTTEDGILWDKVWIRAELESSQTDCYIIQNDNLKEQLRQVSELRQRVEITYARHFFTWVTDCYNDEIVSFKIINSADDTRY